MGTPKRANNVREACQKFYDAEKELFQAIKDVCQPGLIATWYESGGLQQGRILITHNECVALKNRAGKIVWINAVRIHEVESP